MTTTKAPAAARRAKRSHLAVVDNRQPVTLAFERAIQDGLASPERQERWKLELAQLTSEAARKFVHFNNIEGMRKALDINLGLLSFALVYQTNGQTDVAAWAGQVVEKSLEDIVRVAMLQIRNLTHGRGELLFLDLIEPNPRETLLAIATIRDHATGAWEGYESYLSNLKVRSDLHDTDDLGRFLIRLTLEKSPQSWLQGFEPAPPLSEEVINTLVLRYCLLEKGERIPVDPSLTAPYLEKLKADYKADRAAWLASARARYEHLQQLMPASMRAALVNRDWFKQRLAKGPPKWPKKGPEPDGNDAQSLFMFPVYL